MDECHHSAADTYSDLVEKLEPRILLGLTATPERADGVSILPYFGGRPAAEMRLWDALEKQLLAPFEYYGLADGTDLSGSSLGAWRLRRRRPGAASTPATTAGPSSSSSSSSAGAGGPTKPGRSASA